MELGRITHPLPPPRCFVRIKCWKSFSDQFFIHPDKIWYQATVATQLTPTGRFDYPLTVPKPSPGGGIDESDRSGPAAPALDQSGGETGRRHAGRPDDPERASGRPAEQPAGRDAAGRVRSRQCHYRDGRSDLTRWHH